MTRTPAPLNRLSRSVAAGVAAVVLCGGLTGCSDLKDLTSSSKPLLNEKSASSPKVTAAPSPSPSVSAPSVPIRPSGPLDTGTVVHRLKQGNFTVQLTYWTADNAKVYTAAGVKTINVAAHIEDTDSTHRIVVGTFEVIQDDGTARTTVTTDKGTFDVTPPFPYNTVVTLPAATAGATTLTLSVRMDLLVETAPKSNSYYRSTALDTLTLPLLTNGAKQ
jgi:hypothetical protein